MTATLTFLVLGPNTDQDLVYYTHHVSGQISWVENQSIVKDYTYGGKKTDTDTPVSPEYKWPKTVLINIQPGCFNSILIFSLFLKLKSVSLFEENA